MAGVKVYITTPGDPSVGIQGEHITITWPGLGAFLSDHEEREGIRRALTHSWRDLLGERVTVGFEDECPECGTTGRAPGLTCTNPDCPENVAWGQEPGG